MNQIQIQKESRTLDKARVIALNKRVRHSTSNRMIWCVQSESPRTPNKFYRVMFDEELDDFVCECKAFAFNLNVCKHILAYAIFEGSRN